MIFRNFGLATPSSACNVGQNIHLLPHSRNHAVIFAIIYLKTEYTKYQGVKEFDMLARIGCYCKIMVFSPLKLEVTYYHSSKAIKP